MEDIYKTEQGDYKQRRPGSPTFIGDLEVTGNTFDHDQTLQIASLTSMRKHSQPASSGVSTYFPGGLTEHTSAPTDKTPTSPRSLRFSTVQIREYDVVIGDHPSCTEGLSLAIGWNYNQEQLQKIEYYEASRKERRPSADLMLSAKERWRKLANDGGYTEKELFLEHRKILLQGWKAFFSS